MNARMLLTAGLMIACTTVTQLSAAEAPQAADKADNSEIPQAPDNAEPHQIDALAKTHDGAAPRLKHPLKPAIAPNCTAYIDTGKWVYRYSDNYAFNEWMLSLTPTPCGRYIDSTETANMFYEIVKKFGQSEHWTNNRGMINQLTCHLAHAREKPEWNIEPWRPYVGYALTEKALCNPVDPAPDPEYH